MSTGKTPVERGTHPDKDMNAFFCLLRSGLWGQDADDLSLFPLSLESWQRVYLTAKQQTVVGIVYDGLCRLPDELLPPELLLLRWVAEVELIERQNSRMNVALADLYAFFGKHDIRPVLQKGQGVAAFYERPEARECGDIDFYFPKEGDFQKAAQLVESQGKTITAGADGCVSYVWKGIEVEHHPRLLDLYNPFLKSYTQALEQEKGMAELTLSSTPPFTVVVPAPALNLLLLNTHILKHAIGKGVGLRQLCDMARANHLLHSQIPHAEMVRIYRRTGVLRWSKLLHGFLVEWLGLPLEEQPHENNCLFTRNLLAIILKGGNFGQFIDGSTRKRPSEWKRKWQTAVAFIKNIRFSCRYAPKEAFWIVMNLLTGQVKC